MSYSVLKVNTTSASRPYIANISPVNRRDPQLKFEMTADHLEPGIFRARLGAFFNGTFGGDQPGGPPAIYLDADVAIHGLQKIYKLAVENRNGRPPLASEPAPGDEYWPVYVSAVERVESLIAPGVNNGAYEPMSFYTYETGLFGYYVDIDLLVNISETKPVYLKWGSALAGKFATLAAASLQITKIQ